MNENWFETLLEAIKKPVKKKHPLQYELNLRKEIIEKLNEVENADDTLSGIDNILRWLQGIAYNSRWGYERSTARQYWKAISKYLPEKRNEIEAKEQEWFYTKVVDEFGNNEYWWINPGTKQKIRAEMLEISDAESVEELIKQTEKELI